MKTCRRVELIIINQQLEKENAKLKEEIARLKEVRENYESIIGDEWGEDSYLIEKD